MSFGDSKAIVTNQPGIHESLEDIVQKHLNSEFKKPISTHTQQAFDEINAIVQAFDGPVILDSCCGVGQSTRILAEQNPDALVIGVDKSFDRISRKVEDKWQANNFHLVRADLNDFFRLVVDAKWPVQKHYILYPNPWPKAKHVQRRWHGSAVFPYILKIGDTLELRSNWLLYLQEFEFAAKICGWQSEIKPVPEQTPLTPFEAKYLASGQKCWQLVLTR
ncbi:tRNA (guanosine(46)-N(7))-methyltransferase TrmB [Thalassotalea aquiviva]|uniref:tRNA (guanine(46)-N(7))-methyltransferase TrmB n=1 Tax=Thalassotalea aquiviva TaxID=3242415 RepID=UPI00352ABBC4